MMIRIGVVDILILSSQNKSHFQFSICGLWYAVGKTAKGKFIFSVFYVVHSFSRELVLKDSQQIDECVSLYLTCAFMCGFPFLSNLIQLLYVWHVLFLCQTGTSISIIAFPAIQIFFETIWIVHLRSYQRHWMCFRFRCNWSFLHCKLQCVKTKAYFSSHLHPWLHPCTALLCFASVMA